MLVFRFVENVMVANLILPAISSCTSNLLRRYILLFLCLLWTRVVISQGFPCDGSFYYVATDNQNGSKLYQILINETDHSFSTSELAFNNPTKRHVTALGYNVKDQKLYGLDFNSFELLQIDAGGNIESLGIPVNLDTTYHYYAGEMTPDGRRLVVLARNRTNGNDERIYSIRVNSPPEYYAGFFSVISNSPVSMSDITVDPYVGVTYGYDLNKGQVIETDRTGLTSTDHRPFESVSQDFGGLFFDRHGQMYGLGSASRGGGSHNQLYLVSKLTGATTLINATPGGFDSDGCACPYTVEFYKSIKPASTVGCDQIEIIYEAINHAGIGQVGLNVIDPLPPQMKIQDIFMKDLFNVRIHSGVGTNFLDLDRWTLLLGSNILTLVVDVESIEPQIIESQAMLTNLPLAYGSTLDSDDPTTTDLKDPTKLTIAGLDDLSLADYRINSCHLDTTFLTLPLSGLFKWSNGSSDPVLPVIEEGLYSVTVTADCYEFIDSLQVSMASELFAIDLGPDLQLSLGERQKLSFTTNMSEVSVVWDADDAVVLSCYDCYEPTLTATASTSLTLTATDQRGCQATDQLSVIVDQTKRIFIPSAFSPNGDGVNDFFKIFGQSVHISHLQIFDRWGNMILSKHDFDISDDDGWDGFHDGKKLPSGIYLWKCQVRFSDNSEKTYAGEVLSVY